MSEIKVDKKHVDFFLWKMSLMLVTYLTVAVISVY